MVQLLIAEIAECHKIFKCNNLARLSIYCNTCLIVYFLCYKTNLSQKLLLFKKFIEPIGADSVWDGARGFIQVGEWSYPVVPAQSPVLHSFYGAYMFPDATNSVAGK